MISQLNSNQLECLLRGLNAAPPPLPGTTSYNGLSDILASHGVVRALADDIEAALSSGPVELSTLNSAVKFAISENLAMVQRLCIGIAIIAALLGVFMVFISSRISLWLILGMIASVMTAQKFGRERHQFRGERADFLFSNDRLFNISSSAYRDIHLLRRRICIKILLIRALAFRVSTGQIFRK